jgi:ankyrin repeat protein
MNQIHASVFHHSLLENAGDLFKFCAAGEIEKVRKLIDEGENIYQHLEKGFSFTPLFIALTIKNEKLANLFLDIYEHDLEVSNHKRALVAMPEDQTEEFMKTVDSEMNGDDFIPVLLKNYNSATTKCVYMRRKLNNKSDQSKMFAMKLEAKNGLCDLNWQKVYNRLTDSYLHLAIYHDMKSVIEKLLKNPMVDTKTVNDYGHSPLHYAIFTGNLDVIEFLVSTLESDIFQKESSFLYHAVVSGKQKSLDFVIEKLLGSGKSLQEILKIPFTFTEDSDEEKVDNLFHVLAKSSNFLHFFLRHVKSYEGSDFFIQNSNGDTILHRIVQNSVHKLSVKMKLIEKIVEKFPCLLIIENKDGRLPLHLAAFHDSPKQRLYNFLSKLTIKESGNAEIFYSNPDAALSTIIKAIEINHGLSSEYLENFQTTLKLDGPQLLHKCISVDKRHKSLSGILATKTKINPNEFFEGKNAFHVLLFHEVKAYYGKLPEGIFERLQKLIAYHPIENINARDQNGTTIFMFILSFCKDNDFIETLIQSGADCKAKNFENLTCLHHAVMNMKNQEVIKILLKHGADPSI